MTRKEQNKILDPKIESDVNQYKVDRLNAEISAFSSGDLNKYEFLKRIDLNYKPNALDKARFEFSSLGRAFNEGLDKTIPNYQEEGVMKLLKEIRDNLAGLPMLPGPLGPSLTNVTPLPPPDSSSKLLKKYYKKPTKDTELDDIMKEINEQAERNKSLEEQKKLLKQKNEQDKLLKQQKNEQDKILKQQNDEQKKLLEELKKLAEEEEEEEENIFLNITFKNIDSGPFVKFRKSFPRTYIKNPTPSLSKISDPITKSLEPQGVAVGEQAGIAIMENKLETSKNYIEYLKKELRNTDFSSKKALEISDKIIKEEDEVHKLEKEIREREEDIERRFRKYYPDKYYPYKK